MTVTSATSELATVVEELADLRSDRAELVERHEAALRAVDADIADLEARKAHLDAGTTDEELRLARDLILVYGDVSRLTDKLVNEAVEDVVAGCPEMRSHFLALKDYDRFRGQELTCSYIGDLPGNPRHGTVVVAIGLTLGAREFLRVWGKLPLGADGEVGHAAIRYLLNLREAGRP